jgi:hypothetical protein
MVFKYSLIKLKLKISSASFLIESSGKIHVFGDEQGCWMSSSRYFEGPECLYVYIQAVQEECFSDCFMLKMKVL